MCILLVKKLESMPFYVQHDDKESKFKEQHAKMWENIAGAKRYSRPVVSTLRGRAPPSPPPFRRLCSACYAGLARAALITSRHRIYNNKCGLVDIF